MKYKWSSQLPSEQLYQVRDYIYADRLNPSLHERILERLESKPIREYGKDNQYRGTPWDLTKEGIKEVDSILEWIRFLLPDVSKNLMPDPYPHSYNFNPHGFKISNAWGLIYKKNDRLLPHSHYPFALSFVYVVNLPKGSRVPLLVEGRKVYLKEGQCGFFLSSRLHGVGRNKVDGRCVLSVHTSYS